MKRKYVFSEKPKVQAEREKKYYILSINCTPCNLSEPSLMRLNVLIQKYAQEKRIGGYSLHVNETDFWCCNVLADDIIDFWHEVEKILIEEVSFIMRWPEKFEGNLLEVQEWFRLRRSGRSTSGQHKVIHLHKIEKNGTAR
jgi:hypothetical protein